MIFSKSLEICCDHCILNELSALMILFGLWHVYHHNSLRLSCDLPMFCSSKLSASVMKSRDSGITNCIMWPVSQKYYRVACVSLTVSFDLSHFLYPVACVSQIVSFGLYVSNKIKCPTNSILWPVVHQSSLIVYPVSCVSIIVSCGLCITDSIRWPVHH